MHLDLPRLLPPVMNIAPLLSAYEQYERENACTALSIPNAVLPEIRRYLQKAAKKHSVASTQKVQFTVISTKRERTKIHSQVGKDAKWSEREAKCEAEDDRASRVL